MIGSTHFLGIDMKLVSKTKYKHEIWRRQKILTQASWWQIVTPYITFRIFFRFETYWKQLQTSYYVLYFVNFHLTKTEHRGLKYHKNVLFHRFEVMYLQCIGNLALVYIFFKSVYSVLILIKTSCFSRNPGRFSEKGYPFLIRL